MIFHINFICNAINPKKKKEGNISSFALSILAACPLYYVTKRIKDLAVLFFVLFYLLFITLAWKRLKKLLLLCCVISHVART